MSKKKSTAEKLRTRREWYQKNKAKENERKRVDHETQRDARISTMSTYYQQNRKSILKKREEYRDKNRDKILKYKREAYKRTHDK